MLWVPALSPAHRRAEECVAIVHVDMARRATTTRGRRPSAAANVSNSAVRPRVCLRVTRFASWAIAVIAPPTMYTAPCRSACFSFSFSRSNNLRSRALLIGLAQTWRSPARSSRLRGSMNGVVPDEGCRCVGQRRAALDRVRVGTPRAVSGRLGGLGPRRHRAAAILWRGVCSCLPAPLCSPACPPRRLSQCRTHFRRWCSARLCGGACGAVALPSPEPDVQGGHRGRHRADARLARGSPRTRQGHEPRPPHPPYRYRLSGEPSSSHPRVSTHSSMTLCGQRESPPGSRSGVAGNHPSVQHLVRGRLRPVVIARCPAKR